MEAIHTLLLDMFMFFYKLLFSMLEQVPEILTMDMLSQFSDLIEIVKNSMMGICAGIMTIFIIVDIISMIQREEINEKSVFKTVIKIGVTRILIYYTPVLLEFMLLCVNYWCRELAIQMPETEETLNGIRITLSNAIPKNGSGIWGTLICLGSQFLCLIMYLPTLLVCFVTYVLIAVMSYGRNVELVLLTAVSSLPICLIPYNGTKEITKKFILTYASVCLQALLMLLSVSIYTKLISATEANMWEITIYNVLLCLMVTKSSSWAKEILGLA